MRVRNVQWNTEFISSGARNYTTRNMNQLCLPCHDLYSSVLSHICICFNCFLCVSNVDLLFAAWSLQTVFAAENEGDNPIEWLKNSIPGEPDVDYPILASTQQTAFSCDGLIFGGYYADPETRCQQYHVCLQVGFTRNLVSAIIAVPLCAMKTCSNFSGSYWPNQPLSCILPLSQRNHFQPRTV